MTIHHLIAIRSVLPTLKSAREYCGRVRTPQILKSGTFDECYEYALEICCNSPRVNERFSVINGLEVHKNTDWTYFIVQSPEDK